jgi:chemotaxis signal transduction protein
MIEAVTFTLAGETYALESCYAYEVFRLASFARLPSQTPLAFGVTVWRGHLLTILADRAHEVTTIDVGALEPARGRAYVTGLTRDAVLVLDAAKILQLHV